MYNGKTAAEHFAKGAKQAAQREGLNYADLLLAEAKRHRIIAKQRPETLPFQRQYIATLHRLAKQGALNN